MGRQDHVVAFVNLFRGASSLCAHALGLNFPTGTLLDLVPFCIVGITLIGVILTNVWSRQ